MWLASGLAVADRTGSFRRQLKPFDVELCLARYVSFSSTSGGCVMNGIIYLVGLVVVIGVILSFLGLR
jgi:hypothetical protein